MKIRSPRTLIALAVAALIIPSAGATWNSFGTFEPDNALDTPAFMWENAPLPGQQRIYFNVYTGVSSAVRGAVVSPNVGALQTANEAPVMESHMAMFGVWVDCNGDGYVGLAETAQREYPAELLLDDSVCPLVTGPTDEWTQGAHNYNGWVSEYVPIGGISTAFVDDEYDLRVYRDEEAKIWGDPGRPDDGGAAGGSCPIAPQPRGTYQSTGGALNYLDCHADRQGTGGLGLMESFNGVFLGQRLAGQELPGAGDPLGLAFANDDDARGTMYDVATFGTEDSEHAIVTAADCNSEPTANVGESINGTLGDNMGLYDLDNDFIGSGIWSTTVPAIDPQPTSDPTSATVPATLNRTQEDFLEDCDTSNDNGHDFYGNNYVFYVGETDFAPVSASEKRAAQWNFQFQDWGRGGDLLGLGLEAPAYQGGAGMISPFLTQSNWNPGATNTKGDVNRVTRFNLREGSVDLPAALYFTFYAHAGSATTSKGFSLPGGLGTYGSAQCGGNDSGIHNGWDCDATKWYVNPDGSPQPEVTPFARPGDAYEFRDVDCHDGRNGLGVPLSTTGYGNAPCTPYAG